jgi:hypothetical protein
VLEDAISGRVITGTTFKKEHCSGNRLEGNKRGDKETCYNAIVIAFQTIPSQLQ